MSDQAQAPHQLGNEDLGASSKFMEERSAVQLMIRMTVCERKRGLAGAAGGGAALLPAQ